MPSRGEKLLDHADRVTDLHRIVNAFLRNTDASLAECLEHVGFRHALETLKGHVTDDRQLFDFENDVDAAAWTVFDQHASCGLVEESQ